MTIKDETLQLCLQKAGLTELPEAISVDGSDGKTFMTAIALTLRSNGMESYCVVENDGMGKPFIKADFGPLAAVVEIKNIYPVQALDKSVLPPFKSDEDIVKYLCKSLYSEKEIRPLLNDNLKNKEQIAKDHATVKGYIVKAAMDFAKRKAAESERVKEIKTYKSRIKNDKR